MRQLALTQVSVSLTLTVVRQDDNGLRFSLLPILSLTGLFFWLWQIQQLFRSIPAKDILYLAQSFQMVLWVYWNGMIIIIKSVLWGLT